MFIISVDSCVDRSLDELKTLNVKRFDQKFTFKESAHCGGFEKGFEPEAFFRALGQGASISAVPATGIDMQEYFRKIMREGYGDVLHISISSGLDSSWSKAAEAAVIVMNESEFKGRIIFPIDSKSISGGMSILLDNALEMRNNGATARETFDELNKVVNNIQAWFFAPNASQLKKSGQIRGLFGTADLVLTLSERGGVVVDSRHRHQKSAFERLGTCIAETDSKFGTARKMYENIIYAAHSDCLHVGEFAGIIKDKTEATPKIGSFGPISSAYFGAGAAGVFYVGKTKK